MGMTTFEAASILALSPGQVAHLCKTGKLQARKFGPMWEISLESLDEFRQQYHPTARPAAEEKRPKTPKREEDQHTQQVMGEVGVLNSLNALEQKILSSNPLQVFESAAIIKGLLWGPSPRIAALGEGILHEIEFRVGRFFSQRAQSPPFTATHRLIQDSFNPTKGAGNERGITLHLNDFLACKLLMTQGRYYTLQQIVEFEATVLSKIKPASLQKQFEAFQRIGELISPGGITPALRQLTAIGQVTLTAIVPYRERIEIPWPGFEVVQL